MKEMLGPLPMALNVAWAKSRKVLPWPLPKLYNPEWAGMRWCMKCRRTLHTSST